MANDKFLKARMDDKLQEELDRVIQEVQEKTPEANVNASTIARYALEKYIQDHIARRDGTKIFMEVDSSKATDDDIDTFLQLLKKALQGYKEQKAGEPDAVEQMLTCLIRSILFAEIDGPSQRRPKGGQNG